MSNYCDYTNIIYSNGDRFYCCKLFGKKITEDQDVKVIGNHKYGKTNHDVTAVEINSCTISKIPRGLTKIFPNLKVMYIISTNLEVLTKNDLVEYKNLERFHCETSKIEFLPGDLFEDFKNLEWIGFHGNKLNLIEPNILDGLENLKYVHFGDNANYNIWCSDFTVYRPNATLKEIKEKLSEKFCQSNPKNLTNFSNNSISSDLKNHIMNEKFKDFYIEIDNRKFHVHKFLLAARSPTLAEMLCENPEAEHLKLVDIPVKTFELILNYLYTDELPFNDKTNFLSIFVVASRLKIINLANFAASKIMERINGTNALEVLELSNKYRDNGLSQKAFEVLKKKYSHIKFEDEWSTKTDKVKAIIHHFKKIEALEREFCEMMEQW